MRNRKEGDVHFPHHCIPNLVGLQIVWSRKQGWAEEKHEVKINRIDKLCQVKGGSKKERGSGKENSAIDLISRCF